MCISVKFAYMRFDLGAQINLLEEVNDRAFTESGFLHAGIPWVGILCSQLAQVSE